MSYLENCTDLWYLMSDFFYDNKCCNGLIKDDPNYYQFQKNKTIFSVRRIRDNFYKLKVIRRYKKKEQDTLYFECKSLKEIEDTILKYFLKNK